MIYKIKTEDLYADFAPDIPEMFDTSKYKRTNFDGTIIPKMNRKVLGMMKDELGGQMMTEVIGMGPKNYSYSFSTVEGKMDDKSICKGISKSYTPNFSEYLDVIEGRREDVKIDCFRIGSKDHNILMMKTNKVAMNNEVRKRVWDPTVKFETLPFGADTASKARDGSKTLITQNDL